GGEERRRGRHRRGQAGRARRRGGRVGRREGRAQRSGRDQSGSCRAGPEGGHRCDLGGQGRRGGLLQVASTASGTRAPVRGRAREGPQGIDPRAALARLHRASAAGATGLVMRAKWISCSYLWCRAPSPRRAAAKWSRTGSSTATRAWVGTTLADGHVGRLEGAF